MPKLTDEEAEALGLHEDAPAEEARLHPLLSNEEVLAARAKARKKVEVERRRAAIEQMEAQEVERLRREEGLTTGINEKDEIVSVTIDLPPYTPHIMINGPLGHIYWHGQTYQVPRHVGDSLMDMQQRAWISEDQVEGRSLAQQYARKRGTTIDGKTGAVQNAPSRFDA